jgi:anthranilate phosphoribosyltransferase
VEQAQEKFTRALSAGDSPEKDMVLLNSAGALVVRGAAADLPSGVALARTAIDSGAALGKLQQLAELSQSLA